MRRRSSLASSIALSLALSACPPAEALPDAGPLDAARVDAPQLDAPQLDAPQLDARRPDAGALSCRGNVALSVPSPDGAGFCCLPREPTCECSSIGGFASDEAECATGFSAGRVCDVPPRDWGACTFDEHGCPRVTLTMTGACCNCISPDAGFDAP